jgi:hypothetical protein
MVINIQRAVYSIKMNPKNKENQEQIDAIGKDDRPIFDMNMFKKDRVRKALIEC